MLDSLIVPLFVTTDLPPGADLAEFGELLAETARSLGDEGGGGLSGVPGGQRVLARPSRAARPAPAGRG
ncbi:hypothetical protein [Nonomuraea salmonea]|uniref:hypothetical protein n=1 Tax=Nonomuraea salmonea TaxID=46181 RepID=UPI002FE8146F